MEAIATYTLIRWINSCNNEEHLLTANRLADLFRNRYGETPNLTRIQKALQLKRIDIAHLNAVGY